MGDDKILDLGNKRSDCQRALSYVSEKGRDWWFTIRAGDQYFKGSQNLPLVLPTIIGYYLRRNADLNFERIETFIDGRLGNKEGRIFREEISEMASVDFEQVSIRGFTKKVFE